MKEPCETCERDKDSCPYIPKGGAVTICGCNPKVMDVAVKKFSQEMYKKSKEIFKDTQPKH